jgi:hypothetical protein
MIGKSAMEYTAMENFDMIEFLKTLQELGVGTNGLLVAALTTLAFILVVRPFLLRVQQISDQDSKKEKEKSDHSSTPQ